MHEVVLLAQKILRLPAGLESLPCFPESYSQIIWVIRQQRLREKLMVPYQSVSQG